METIRQYIIYLCMALGVIAFIYLIRLLISFLKLGRTIGYTADKFEPINRKLEHIREDNEKIDYTVHNTLPLFIGIFSAWTLIRMIFNDYKKTDRDKRSIVKSSMNVALKRPTHVHHAVKSIRSI
ncbi:MAG: hypothetical protein Q4D13_07620 [Erysipelotrichaceae bacterium]|nr:hypothetical protein [Erysipelotrichaceae bacterium]